MIRGEYCIVDGSVEFADGDVGDYNHEAIATNHVFQQWASSVQKIAEEYEIETEFETYGELNTEAVSEAIQEILEILEQNNSEEQSNQILMNQLGIDQEAYLVLCGFGEAQTYVMKNEGWIAVRGENVDLYGYDRNKMQSLSSGIYEILESEGIEYEEIEQNDEYELAINDFKSGKSFYVTLMQLREPEPTLRPQQWISNKGDSRHALGTLPDEGENKYSYGMYNQNIKPNVNKPNPWKDAAVKNKIMQPNQDMWRLNSESFKQWFTRCFFN